MCVRGDGVGVRDLCVGVVSASGGLQYAHRTCDSTLFAHCACDKHTGE